MNRTAFLSQDHVKAFVRWLAVELPILTVRLRVSASPYVPGGINEDTKGVEDVLRLYRWAAAWTDPRTGVLVRSECWQTTRKSLAQLAQWLRESLAAGDEQATADACLQVLRWGGVRGAVRFIEAKRDKNQLCGYLTALAPFFSLDGQHSLDGLDAGNVERFDAGLTKVHALLDRTGSPIYDSRVGAALAMLYALFTKSEAYRELGAYPPLRFPSGAARLAQIRDPGTLGHDPAPQFYTRQVKPEQWARWQLCAGWIMQAVLEENIALFANEPADDTTSPMAARMLALQGALFMIGYDLRSLTGDMQAASAAVSPRKTWVPSGFNLGVSLRLYLEFRETSPADYGAAAFKQWLAARGDDAPSKTMYDNFREYSLPLGEREFSLYEAKIEQVRRVVNGGEDGLYVANGDNETFALGDERQQLCLVCAGLAGLAGAPVAEQIRPIDWLVERGHANTAASANTLLATGRAVGRHFGLLAPTGKPTELFDRFFGDSLISLR